MSRANSIRFIVPIRIYFLSSNIKHFLSFNSYISNKNNNNNNNHFLIYKVEQINFNAKQSYHILIIHKPN
jgi:hypothetical protein